MLTTICLLRHARAGGHGPESELLPEGEAYVAALGRRLAREGWSPVAAFSSPYRRARDTARIVLDEAACDAPLTLLAELTPDRDPDDALAALTAHGMREGRVLVVGHMPLLGRLALQLTGETVDFHPGTLAEIELGSAGGDSVLTRRLGPEELAGG
jgi:phosphohistidine phosphatase